jgi:hypothetical protein
MQNAANKDPLRDVDWINGRAVEVFYADKALAREFGGSAGWYWWSRRASGDAGELGGPLRYILGDPTTFQLGPTAAIR